MKFVTFLFALLAVTSYVQAHIIEAKLSTRYDDVKPTKGKITLDIKGKNQVEHKVFDKIDFHSLQNFPMKFLFSEQISEISVKWESESKKPIYLNDFSMIVDGVEFINYLMGLELKNGESKTFKRFN